MGSPLGPTLANAFLCHYEKEWLDNCPIHFKPVIYKRYVDDIFVLFSSKEHLQLFVDYMNKQHKCLKFTSEAENDNSFSFLDIKITRHNQQFKTSVYRKPTFSGVFTHYKSYLDQTYKKSSNDTLLLRCFSICSDYTLLHLKVENLREILKKNSEHIGISHLTGKRVECKPCTVLDHLLMDNPDSDFNDFTILCRDNHGFRLLLKESSEYLEILPFLIRTLHLFHYCYLIDLRYYQWDLVNIFLYNFLYILTK